MPLPRISFEFEPAKAYSNLKKHGVDFLEAITVFNDPLASTLDDDQHSVNEIRSITIGLSSKQRLLFVVYTETISGIRLVGARLANAPRNANMKKSPELDPLAPRPNLDFSKGVRGKHFDRMQQGTNAVLIAPDLVDTFPDSESVNEALRSLKKIAARTVAPATRQRKTAAASQ